MMIMNEKQLIKMRKDELWALLSEKNENHYFHNTKPTKINLIEAILAYQRVDEFNEKSPTEIELRIHEDLPWKKVEPRGKAFVPKYHQCPAVFLKGKCGYFMITEEFCKF